MAFGRFAAALDAMMPRPLQVFALLLVLHAPPCRPPVGCGGQDCDVRLERDVPGRDESDCDAQLCDFRQRDGRLDVRH